MKIFLVVFLFTIAVHSREYHYNKPNVGFYQEDLQNPGQTEYVPLQQPTIIKGQYGRNYEVTMMPSQKLYETRQQQITANQQTGFEAATNPGNLQQYTNPQPQAVLTSPNPAFYGNTLQQTQPQSAPITHPYPQEQQQGILTSPNPAYYSNALTGNLQQHVNQYSAINQPQTGHITNQYTGLNPNSYTQHNTQQQQQQQYANQYSNLNSQQQQGVQNNPQQIGLFSQQNNNNNNLPNSNNLLQDLVNNKKYVSQSEAAQLDVYPYKQLQSGNTRPFARFATKCDAQGRCEPQNAGGDFHHQQVLKQSKAKIETVSDKCRGYDYSPNSLDSEGDQNSQNSQNFQNAQNGLGGTASYYRKASKAATSSKDRRLFPYSEVVLPQYPTN